MDARPERNDGWGVNELAVPVVEGCLDPVIDPEPACRSTSQRAAGRLP